METLRSPGSGEVCHEQGEYHGRRRLRSHHVGSETGGHGAPTHGHALTSSSKCPTYRREWRTASSPCAGASARSSRRGPTRSSSPQRGRSLLDRDSIEELPKPRTGAQMAWRPRRTSTRQERSTPVVHLRLARRRRGHLNGAEARRPLERRCDQERGCGAPPRALHPAGKPTSDGMASLLPVIMASRNGRLMAQRDQQLWSPVPRGTSCRDNSSEIQGLSSY
jgi:hypothetical protein